MGEYELLRLGQEDGGKGMRKKLIWKEILRGILKVLVLAVAVGLLAGGSWLWRYRNRVDIYLLLRRPDIYLALATLDERTPVEEKRPLSELAVWYLIRSEHPLTYTWLYEKLNKSCWNPSQYVNGPSQYAARILGEKSSERSVEELTFKWMLPRRDGPNRCAWRALQGLTLKGEEVVPLMLEVATDPEASSNNRYEAISWLGEMGSDPIRNFYCLPIWGCEQLGSEVGEEWVDELIELLENDPDSNVRLPAAKALYWIGDPRGIEAIRNAYEVETDWRVLKAIESILEELDQ